MKRNQAFTLDADGNCHQARRIQSPNADARPQGEAIRLIVIHNISLPAGQFGSGHVERLFTNTLDTSVSSDFVDLDGLKVSSHFFIDRTGALEQYVPCELRAWHAGASCWQGRTRCNDFSIGVELEGTDRVPYENEQYEALRKLIEVLCKRYPIEGITGHEHIAPGRKTDPGEAFDWARLRSSLNAPAHWFAGIGTLAQNG